MAPEIERAKAVGFYVYRGSFTGTTDDRLDRWYVGRLGQTRAPFAPGYRTRREAWARAAEIAQELSNP